jgi:hypothetical protein
MACSIDSVRSAAAERVYLITGSKGGVGKSMLAHVLIDQLLLRDKRVLYVECDTANPDVWHCLQRDPDNAPGETVNGITAMTVRLEDEQSWADIVTALDDNPDHVGVIGGASRTTEAVVNHGHILRETLPELGRELVTLWVIDEQRDSLGPLQKHLAIFGDSPTHVVKNSPRGPEAFALYEGSKLRTAVESKGGSSLLMPRLGPAGVSALYSERLAIARALDVLPLANRYLMRNFRASCGCMLEPILAP